MKQPISKLALTETFAVEDMVLSRMGMNSDSTKDILERLNQYGISPMTNGDSHRTTLQRQAHF